MIRRLPISGLRLNFIVSAKRNFSQTSFLSRSKNYASLNPFDVQFFRDCLGEKNVLIDPKILQKYNTDPSSQFSGLSNCAILPETTDQIQKILEYSNYRKLAIVPQGGNTSLVGGSVSIFDEVLLSMQNFNKILEFDKSNGKISCEAGCTLTQLAQYCSEMGFQFPINHFKSHPNSTIGGIVATNSGIISDIKKHSLQGLLLGIKSVFPTSEVFDDTKNLMKDNTGLHLKNLLVGSEGTLGIITECSHICANTPKQTKAFLVGAENFEHLFEIYNFSQIKYRENFASCEFYDRPSLEIISQNSCINEISNEMISKKSKLFAVLEFQMKRDLPNGYFNELMKQKNHSVKELDSMEQISTLWSSYYKIPEYFINNAISFRFDFCLPLEKMESFTNEIIECLPEVASCAFFGNLFEKSLYVEIAITKEADIKDLSEMNKTLVPLIYQKAHQNYASLGGGRGIGMHKVPYILNDESEDKLDLMQEVKMKIDPNLIMNPYKMFPHGRRMLFKSNIH